MTVFRDLIATIFGDPLADERSRENGEARYRLAADLFVVNRQLAAERIATAELEKRLGDMIVARSNDLEAHGKAALTAQLDAASLAYFRVVVVPSLHAVIADLRLELEEARR